MPEDARRILLIEDDAKTARAVCAVLEREGFATGWAATGEEGFYRLNAETFDAVLLDWMLPGRDGLEILQTLRARGVRAPVLQLTARDALEDRVLGLDGGADDYLIKPFAFEELLARLRALLRRVADGMVEQPPPTLRNVADLTLDLATRRVRRGERDIDLTAREFDLLACLLSHGGRIVTREMLAREVWRELQRATPLDNVIDVHVARLRRKIDEGEAVRLIHTVRSVGFVLREGNLRKMNRWWRKRSRRLRLTLWYAAASFVILLALGVLLLTSVRGRLGAQLDQQLQNDFAFVAARLEHDNAGRVRLDYEREEEQDRHPKSDGDENDRMLSAAWFEVWSPGNELLLRRRPGEEDLRRPGPPLARPAPESDRRTPHFFSTQMGSMPVRALECGT